jgi:hypothetical protein
MNGTLSKLHCPPFLISLRQFLLDLIAVPSYWYTCSFSIIGSVSVPWPPVPFLSDHITSLRFHILVLIFLTGPIHLSFYFSMCQYDIDHVHFLQVHVSLSPMFFFTYFTSYFIHEQLKIVTISLYPMLAALP